MSDNQESEQPRVPVEEWTDDEWLAVIRTIPPDADVSIGEQAVAESRQMSVSLMHGKDWQVCCICFERHSAPFEGKLAPVLNQPGKYWDVCIGQCAIDAGLDKESDNT